MILFVYMIPFFFLKGCAAQAHTMVHPAGYAYMDYPDVASIGGPRPILFYSGLQNNLFLVQAVVYSYQKMQAIGKDQNPDGNFFTKLRDVKHTFNKEMELETVKWLDNY